MAPARQISASSQLQKFWPVRMTFRLSFCAIILCLSAVAGANGQDISAPEPQSGVIVGTALDVNGNPIPGARIALEGPLPADRQQAVTNENGFFELSDVRAGVPCHVTIAASGFADWNSPEVTLRAGQYLELTGINLKLGEVVTTVYATSSSDEIATEQVQIAEHQRVLGVVPNFYVTYDPHPVALTPGLKFRLALRALTDPVTFLGAATVAGMDQAADKFDFQQDAKGYFQRFGASYANMFTDIMVGGAVLPSLLHQDPRYIYQGTGTTKARALHAISYPFITRGDNGHRQPNYSNLGGVLASGAIANAYYPASNRGPGLVLNTAVIDICTSMANGLLQEFVFRRLTPSAKERVSSSVSGKASSSRSGN